MSGATCLCKACSTPCEDRLYDRRRVAYSFLRVLVILWFVCTLRSHAAVVESKKSGRLDVKLSPDVLQGLKWKLVRLFCANAEVCSSKPHDYMRLRHISSLKPLLEHLYCLDSHINSVLCYSCTNIIFWKLIFNFCVQWFSCCVWWCPYSSFLSVIYWLIITTNHSRSDLHVMKTPVLTPCLTPQYCARTVPLQAAYMHTVVVGVHISIVAVY